MHETEADAVVLGAGPAGEVAAGMLAEAGLDVTIVESHLVGGECSFYGCMPSKALLRPVELRAEADRVPGVSERIAGPVDAQAVLDRRDEVIHELDDAAQLPWLQQRGIRLVRGHGQLAGERMVDVLDADGRPRERIAARRAVLIATGTRATRPPIPGLDELGGWTNREATTADQAPRSLLALGGGPIGCELAQAWAALGSRVTLIEAAPRILGKEEPFAAAQVTARLRADGVDVRTGLVVAAVAREGDRVVATLEGGEQLEADELLVAAGRTPNLDRLGLDRVGLPADERGFLTTDASLRVAGSDWLYALGDVNGRALLTHQGKRQARVAAAHLLGHDGGMLLDDELDGERSPRVTFTDPQVAAVGWTLDAARNAGIDAVPLDGPSDGTAGASFVGRNAGGTTRFVVDRKRGVLVGATFVGAGVAEQLHAATVAIVGEVPLARLDAATPAFPTRNEIWLRLIER